MFPESFYVTAEPNQSPQLKPLLKEVWVSKTQSPPLFSPSHSELCPTSCVIPVLSCLPQLHLFYPLQTNSKLSAILIGLVTGWGWSYYPAIYWSHMLRKAEKLRDGLCNHSYQLSKSGNSTTIPFSLNSHVSIFQ